MEHLPQQLSRSEIIEALADLNRGLSARGVIGEVCLYGGAVMVLAFNARPATRDVDAVFHPAPLVRELAAAVAETRGLPADWLNDGVKGYLSAQPALTAEDLPLFPNLRLTRPTAQYLLAMKCLASRTGRAEGEADDVADIRFLIRRLGLKSAPEVLEVIGAFYPADRMPVRARFLVETLFEEEPS